MGHIKTIGIENFRLFKNKTVFDLAPITILTGINNSGKSSLIKTLQLFKSSIQNTGGLIKLDFTGGRHNLGHFGFTVNNESEECIMRFYFDFPLKNFREKTFIELEYSSQNKEAEAGSLTRFRVFTENDFDILEGCIEDEGGEMYHCYKMDIEGLFKKFSKIYQKTYFDELKTKKERDIFNDPDFLSKMQDEYFNELNGDIFVQFPKSHRSTIEIDLEKWDNNYDLIKDFNDLSPRDQEEITERLKSIKEGFYKDHHEDYFTGENLISKISGLGSTFENIITLKYYSADDRKNDIKISSITDVILNKFLKLELPAKLTDLKKRLTENDSLSSIRANSERLYFNNSNIVDINLLLLEFSRIKIHRSDVLHNFIKWSLNHFNIGDEIVVKRHQGISSEIFIRKGEKLILLADMGFGFTQLVPIIIKIVIIAKNKRTPIPMEEFPPSIFLLEEPESNLHPSYQSKLAELIIKAASLFNIQFIIETHSEYMIRNFQYLTAVKKLKPADTKIYYFHQPGSEDFNESPYRIIEIGEDGRLSNEFGEGFFDEIPRLLAFLYNSNFN